MTSHSVVWLVFLKLPLNFLEETVMITSLLNSLFLKGKFNLFMLLLKTLQCHPEVEISPNTV